MFQLAVGFKVQVLKFMFHGVQILTDQNEHQATIKTQHVFVLVCFGVHIARK
jgi:hypothetical protein